MKTETIKVLATQFAAIVAPIVPAALAARQEAIAGNNNGAIGNLVVARKNLVDAIAILDAALLIAQADDRSI